ncbi:hypothetical protein DM01DRAFT_1070863 [Hesseltinella vesiculosa]|uniref:Uncharacterized protein n=1 Tax=Hesseltinella vesiculosa TaxID=101127 RepID=A0A1X2GVI4_9FUNG|nr:hypothetical protein DM01DRAFT_1070863 [Hesseltinella vesiculosa]
MVSVNVIFQGFQYIKGNITKSDHLLQLFLLDYLMTQLTLSHLNAFLERSDERVPVTALTLTAPPSRILGIVKDYVYQNFAIITRTLESLPLEIPERHRSLTVLVLNELWAMTPLQLPTITQETLRADPG